jgi:hypothetical protein
MLLPEVHDSFRRHSFRLWENRADEWGERNHRRSKTTACRSANASCRVSKRRQIRGQPGPADMALPRGQVATDRSRAEETADAAIFL